MKATSCVDDAAKTADTRTGTAEEPSGTPPWFTGKSAVLAALLSERHSTRAFLPQQVEQPRIDHILQLAQRTATWSNLQPWHVLIASGAAVGRLSTALLEAAASDESSYDLNPPENVDEVLQRRGRDCGNALSESVGIGRDDAAGRWEQDLKNFGFFGAPHVALISVAAQAEDYGHVDAGAYIANFLLAAESVGVATIVQAATAAYSCTMRRAVRLPASRTFVASIAFGLEDPRDPINRFRSTRADISESVSYLNS